MIDVVKAKENWPDVLGAMPRVELERGESELTHLFRNAQLVLSIQGFELQRIGGDFVLQHNGNELITAPSMGDMLLLLCIAGAWSNITKEGK